MVKSGMVVSLLVVGLFSASCEPLAPEPNAGARTDGSAPVDEDPHMTGLIPTTPEERAWLLDNAISPTEITPNQLALERIQAESLRRGLTPMAPAQVVAVWRGQASQRALPLAVPVAVDNSELPAFLPIRSQGQQGSCASFSSTYYQWTHMVALAYGWDAKNGGDQYRMSPKWTYNIVNGGEDAGSTASAPFGVLQRHGCATWAQFPYSTASNPANYRPWCMQTDTWRSALRYRLDQSGSVYGIDRLEGLQALKQLLANGYVLQISTYINSWQYLAGGVPDDPASVEDDPYVGQSVCHWMNGTNGPHGMTVVGYNDAIWVDVNGDGQVDEGEKGALKIANSWGSGWHSGGYTWIAYDALRDVSRVAGAPGANRRGAFDSAVWATVRPNYQPIMTGEFTLTHALRNQLQVTLGLGETSDVEPTERFYPSAPNYSGGPYAFDGTLSRFRSHSCWTSPTSQRPPARPDATSWVCATGPSAIRPTWPISRWPIRSTGWRALRPTCPRRWTTTSPTPGWTSHSPPPTPRRPSRPSPTR